MPFRVRHSLRWSSPEMKAVIPAQTMRGTNECIPLGVPTDPLHRVPCPTPEDFMRHAVVLGSTGSGKSNTASYLARELSRHASVVIIDWYGEHVDEGDVVIDPAAGDPVPIPADRVSMLELLEEVLDLSPPQSYVLMKVLRNGIGLDELVREVEYFTPEGRWENESRLALIRRLSPLAYSNIRSVAGGWERAALSDGLVLVLDLSRVHPLSSRRLVALSVLRYLETVASPKRKVFVIVEEAQNLVKANGLVARQVAEVRKKGLGIVLVTQSPSKLGEDILLNVNVRIIHSLRSWADIEVMARSSALGNDAYRVLPKLRVGEALVEYHALSHPLLVRFPKVLEPSERGEHRLNDAGVGKPVDADKALPLPGKRH